MKRSLFAVGLVIAFIVITSGGWVLTHKSSKEIGLANCYYGNLQKDQLLIKINSQIGNQVNANIYYQNFEKDSSYGYFRGTFINSKLSGKYNYFAEGVLSFRDITYTKSADSLNGDGFTLKASASCKLERFGSQKDWKSTKVIQGKTDTIHDPETGFYARSFFTLPEAKNNELYWCQVNIFDKSGNELNNFATGGRTFDPNPTAEYSGQANLRPEQVALVATSKTNCELANL